MTSSLLGTWKLLHCTMVDIDGVEQFDSFHNASGILMYDANNLMAVQVMRHDHTNTIEGTNVFIAPAESVKNAFESYIAYYGTYTIDERAKIVAHSVLGAQWPNMVGTQVSRRFEFKNENTVVLSPVTHEDIATEKPVIRYLTWEHITSAQNPLVSK